MIGKSFERASRLPKGLKKEAGCDMNYKYDN